LPRFFEVAAGTGHRNPFLQQQPTGIEQRFRTEVVHVIVGDGHRIEAAIGKYLRHRRGLATMRLAVTLGPRVGAAVRILALAIRESQIDAPQRRPDELAVAFDRKSIRRAVHGAAVARADE
jgi:hypothetical protein